MSETNYASGDEYVVEFLGYRFGFNAEDFEERVTAAAVRLGLIGSNDLDEEETADLVELAADGRIAERAQPARPLPRPPLGAGRPARGRVARLLAAEARLPRCLARPPRQGGTARGHLGRGDGRLRLRGAPRRPCPARARPRALLARAPVPQVTRALALLGFIGLLLAVDTQVDAQAQLLLGLAAWLALALALRGLPPLLRAQALVVVGVATCAEVVGSIIWGVYTYRLENLPSFVPPCHGLVYLAGAALAAWAAPRQELLVRVALVAVLAWGLAGVTVLPRADVGGALGAALLAVFLAPRPRAAVYAGVFLVVAWLELYGTAIGTWEWAAGDSGHRRPAGEPAERRRLGLRLVRHRRARAGAPPARRAAGGAAEARCRLSLNGDVSVVRKREPDRALGFRPAQRELADRPERDDHSSGSPCSACGTSVMKP